ncbi:MAG: DUF1059 domain-containing protein [Candidatus Heimdallarchaeota archaeon]
MTKEVRCRDLGVDCDGVIQGETEGEILNKVAAHAKEVHNMTEISDELAEKVRSVMREV